MGGGLNVLFFRDKHIVIFLTLYRHILFNDGKSRCAKHMYKLLVRRKVAVR